MDKINRLKQILRGMDSVLVAYSGGVDSTFLLKAAHDVLKDRVLAVTAISETFSLRELASSKRIAASFGVRHRLIKTYELKDKRFASNPANRCYFCKLELFSKLKKIAERDKFNFVVDASNASDISDFRPGSIAKKELKVRSPLQEAGFTKEDIRRFSKKIGLKTWDKPSSACLASRIPYGTIISKPLLKRIDAIEAYLFDLGFKQARLRHYNGLCRIEVDRRNIPKLINKRKRIIDKLKKMGYNYVTLDLEGYRTGNMNPVRSKLPKVTYTPSLRTSNGVNEVIK